MEAAGCLGGVVLQAAGDPVAAPDQAGTPVAQGETTLTFQFMRSRGPTNFVPGGVILTGLKMDLRFAENRIARPLAAGDQEAVQQKITNSARRTKRASEK